MLGGICMYFSLPHSLSVPDSSKSLANPTSTRQKLASIDYLGAFLLVAAFILLLSALANGTFDPVLLLVSIMAFCLFLYVEFRVAADPIVPLSILSSRAALLSCLSQMGIMSARWFVLFFVPLAAMGVRGLHPSAAGSLLVPTSSMPGSSRSSWAARPSSGLRS